MTEFADTGLVGADHYAIEGAMWALPDLDDWLDDDERRGLLFEALRSVESAPTLLGISSHLLAVAARPMRNVPGRNVEGMAPQRATESLETMEM